VQDIYTRVIRGDALTRIAHDLNVAEVRPRRGTAWTHTGIGRLIASPALGGLIRVDGELRRAAFSGAVDEDTWRSANAALRRRPRGESRRPREQLTLLGGLLVCAEHGHVCFGGSATHTPIYVAHQPGQCHVSISRSAADEVIKNIVIERLRRPDAAGLFSVLPDKSHLQQEINSLVSRRDGLADLVADGLLTSAAARPRLTDIKDQLAKLEARLSPAVLDPRIFADPLAVWTSWTTPQRREALRLLFAKISIRHVGQRNGPRADPTRLVVEWAQAA
jgi:hypothetical protein